MWQVVIDELQREVERGGMEMNNEELFSPAWAVVLKLSLVQLHGQIWDNESEQSLITQITGFIIKYNMKRRGTMRFTNSFISKCFMYFLSCLVSLSSKLPLLCELPPALHMPHTAGHMVQTLLASGHGAAAVLQQALLTVKVYMWWWHFKHATLPTVQIHAVVFKITTE